MGSKDPPRGAVGVHQPGMGRRWCGARRDADCVGLGRGAYCGLLVRFPITGSSVEPFLARVRLAMDRRGLTQRELAHALGVREATVSAWFQQGKLPGGATMLALPRVLDADGHWLLTGEHRDGAVTAMDAARLAELEALLARALAVLQGDGAAVSEPAPVRVRAASEGEQRALDAVRRFGVASRAAPRGTGGC